MSCRWVNKWGEDSGWWADRATFGSRLISPTAIYCNRDIHSLPMYSYILMWYLWNIIRSTSMLNYWKQDTYYDKCHENNETTSIKGVSRRTLFIKTVIKNPLMVIHGWILLHINVALQRLWQNTNRSSCRWNKPAHSNKTKILWRHKQLNRGDTGRHNKGAGVIIRFTSEISRFVNILFYEVFSYPTNSKVRLKNGENTLLISFQIYLHRVNLSVEQSRTHYISMTNQFVYNHIYEYKPYIKTKMIRWNWKKFLIRIYTTRIMLYISKDDSFILNKGEHKNKLWGTEVFSHLRICDKVHFTQDSNFYHSEFSVSSNFVDVYIKWCTNTDLARQMCP